MYLKNEVLLIIVTEVVISLIVPRRRFCYIYIFTYRKM